MTTVSLYKKMIIVIALGILLGGSTRNSVHAESSVPQTDQNPITPLVFPNPTIASPRYISGFGVNDTYTIFYEDRNDSAGCAFGYRIYYNQTASGVPGLSAIGTPTNICDTHLLVKNWPITILGTTYSYRAWGSVDNNPSHTFYVSNDLTNWTLLYVGVNMFSDPGGVLAGDGGIYYGFHDIIQLNGNYIGWVESNGGRTYIVWSDDGDQNWTIMSRVGGGTAADTPLNLYFFPGITGPIPSGNFLLMELDGFLTYAKLYIPGDRSAAYLAINRAAAQAATPALAETAFMNPGNWTWRDGSIGLPGAANSVITSTLGAGGHDVRETWSVPASDYRADHVILYTARYGSGPGRGVGCAATNTQCRIVLPATPPPDPGGGVGGGGGGGGTGPDAEAAIGLRGRFGFIIPVTGFAPSKTTNLVPQPANFAYLDEDIMLEIPSLGVQVPVVGVPRVDGGWDVTWLGNMAGYLEGTAFPTWAGNSAIAGHVYNSNGAPGPFVGLSSLVYSDRVLLHAWGSVYTYEVTDNRLVLPNDQTVFQDDAYPSITLLTCQGYDAVYDTYMFRRAVHSILVNVSADS